MSLIGGVLSGIGSALGAYIQGSYNNDLYRQQYRDSLDMYHMQLRDQRQLIDEERNYNSPQAYAARLSAAGINPDLQNISQQATTAGTAPTPNVPVQQPLDIQGAIQSIVPATLSAMSNIMDIRSKSLDLDKKAAELFSVDNSFIDDSILSSFSDSEIDRLFAVLKSKGAESFTKGELKGMYDSIISDGHVFGGRLNAAGKVENVSQPLLNRLAHIFDDYYGSRRKAKRMFARAVTRLRSVGFDSSYLKNRRTRSDDELQDIENRSRPWYSNDGQLRNTLSSLIDAVVESEKSVAKLTTSQANQGDILKEAMQPFYELVDKWSNSDKWFDKLGSLVVSFLITQMRSSLTFSKGPKSNISQGFISFGQ